MGPGLTLNARSMNKRYASVNSVFLSEDGDTSKRTYIRDGDQESSNGVRSSKKTKKSAVGKLQPTITFIPSEEQFVLHSQTIASSYDCLSFLRQKCSGGTQPRAVGKRTPRFPVSYTHVNISKKNFISPARPGLKIKADADDEVVHEIAITLAEARKDGSPLVSRIPHKRAEDVMSSPEEPYQPKEPIAEMNYSKLGMDVEDLEGQIKAVISERSRHTPSMMEPISCGTERKKGLKLSMEKQGGYDNNEENFNAISKELCGNKESNLFGATRSKFATQANGIKIRNPSMQSQRRGEGPSFDALRTLSDLSSMMPTENGDGSKLQLNCENVDHFDDSVLDALPVNQQKRTCRSSRVKTEGRKSVSSIEVACRKTSKSGKGSVIDVRSIPEENQDPLSSVPKRTRKKQKIHVSVIQKTEAPHDNQLIESTGIEDIDCMPSNPLKNMLVPLERHQVAVDKEAVLELRHMNDDVMGNQKDRDSSLNDLELFKKKHDAILPQLSEVNEEVASALFGLRRQNTHRGNSPYIFPRPISNVSDPDGALNSFGGSAFQAKESGTRVAQLIDDSRTKAQTILDAAMQEISSLKNTEDTVEKIENALAYANSHIPPHDSCMPVHNSELANASIIQAQIPSELITNCVAALLMIQNCTERRVPPSDIAQILDSAVMSLRPRSSHNLPIYTEVQRCMGIIRHQIMALIPT